MSLTFDQLDALLQSMLIVDPTSQTDWETVVLPAIIQGGELKCYTDIDFATADVKLTTIPTVANQQTIVVPPSIVLVRHLSYYDATAGFVTLDMRDDSYLFEYVGGTLTGPPKYCAVQSIDSTTGTTLLLGPIPDKVYNINGHGIQRPAPLSAANETTYLSTVYPNLLLYACLVWACGYQRNFGQASEDPQMALSWNAEYEKAKAAVLVEENRKKSFTYGAASTAAPSTPPP